MTAGKEASHSSDLAAGLRCPQCRNSIQFSLQLLLQSPDIRCPECGLTLTIDTQQSEAALSALRKFNAEIAKIQQDQDIGTPKGGG
jgi:uncharacterized paraquat-inducible protein A